MSSSSEEDTFVADNDGSLLFSSSPMAGQWGTNDMSLSGSSNLSEDSILLSPSKRYLLILSQL